MEITPERSFMKDLKSMDKRLDVKFCTICKELKKLADFYIRDREGCGSRPKSACKQCESKKAMAWATNNREKANASVRRWREKYPEREKASCRRWRTENPEKVRCNARKRMKKRRTIPKWKLHSNISCQIFQAIRGEKAGRKWEDLVGYTVDQLKVHLEKRFKPGMTWENYGKVWSIDHKIPVSVFNFERPEDIDFHICWSLKNLRPLECSENSKKKAKIDKPFQPSLAIAAEG